MNEKKVCKYCKKIFTPTCARNTKYCSVACKKRDYYENGNKHREDFSSDEIIREFCCRQCGKQVNVVEKRDRRTTYCSPQCERAYHWNKEKSDNYSKSRSRSGVAGMSGGMSLGSLIRREKYALR